jgi:hypothetical protein
MLPLAAHAQTDAIQGACTQEGVTASVSGLQSTNRLDGIIPGCIVTVYLTGTTTKATIYSDGSSTSLLNPFTADVAPASNFPGKWIFWAGTGTGYDVVMSGGGGNPSCTTALLCYAHPRTLTDVKVGGGGGGGGGSGSVTSVSVATANGFQGTVANPTTTPAITVNVDSTHVLPVNTGSTTNFLNQAGTYTVPASAALPVTTKGDLLGFSSVPARVPVGTDNFCLIANSTLSLGLGWAACPNFAVSGQAAGVVPLATGANAIGAQSHISDNGTKVTISEPTQFNDGTGNAGTLQPSVGPDSGGVTGHASYTTDATNGYAEVHEGTSALSRLCTAANGVCSGGSSWASITGGVSPTGQTYSLGSGSAITPGDGTIEASSVNSSTAGVLSGSNVYLPINLATCTNPISPLYPNSNACDQLTMSYSTPNNTNAARSTTQYSYGDSSPVSGGITDEGGTYRIGNQFRGSYNDMGGKGVWAEATSFNGIGDALDHVSYVFHHAGVAYGSDQGFQANFFQGGEGNSIQGQIASGGQGATTLGIGSSNCNAGLLPIQGVSGCGFSIGTWIVDASDPHVATTTLANTTSTEFPCNGTALNWVYYLTTGGGLPYNGSDTYHCAYAIGSPTAVVPPDGTKPGTPATISLTAGGTSQQLVNGFACAIGSNFVEPTTISGVSGSSFSADLSRTNTNIMFWQNTTAPNDPNICGIFSFNQDAAVTGTIDAFNYIGSPDGTKLIYAWPSYGTIGQSQLAGNGGYFGGGVSPAAVGGTITVYPAAWIVRLNGTSNSDGTFTPTGLAVRENNARWTTGDNFYDPDFPKQSTVYDAYELGCLTIDSQCYGEQSNLGGAGFSGSLNANFFGGNFNQQSMYYNGSFVSTGITPPNWGAIGTAGAGGTNGYGNYFTAGTSPALNGFEVWSHWAGQTSYNIWNDRSSDWGGELALEQANGFHFYRTPVHIQQMLYADGGCTGCGTGIWGGTSGYIPLFGSATTITGNSPMDAGITTASVITATEPIAVSGISALFSYDAVTMSGDDPGITPGGNAGQVSAFGYNYGGGANGGGGQIYLQGTNAGGRALLIDTQDSGHGGGTCYGCSLGTNIPNGFTLSTGSLYLNSGLTGYMYANSTGAVTASTTIPWASTSGTSSTSPVCPNGSGGALTTSGCTGSGGGGGSSVGTAGQMQMVGATSGSFAASSCTDNGTNVTCTEPTVAPSLIAGTPSAGALAALPTGAHGSADDESSTAGVPAANVDYLRADSAAHCYEMSLNGGTEACIPTASVHTDYANIAGTLFATNTMLGPVFAEPVTATYKTIIVRMSGSITCATAPAVTMEDLGTSPSTAFGSVVGSVDSVTTGTSDGVYQHSASVNLTPGHYYGFAFSGGACAVPPNFDITAQIQ